MSYRVCLLQDAVDDLLDIYDFSTQNSPVKVARALLSQLKKSCRSLATLPRRGHYPQELQRVGITHYREIHCGHHRIIYEIVGEEIHIHAILDGRRSVQELLERRLLR